MMPAAAVPAASTRFPALDALRGLAVLMVVYDHLFAVAGERFAGGPFLPVPWVREWVTGPLGIIQDFGWFGVCLFFLISGFVIAHAADREPVRVFVVRRVLRIFPPLAVTVALVAVLDWATGRARPWSDYALGASLAGYVTVPQVIVLGVAWTLVVEILFYALMALVSPLLKSRRPALAIVAAGLCCAAVLHQARAHGDAFFLLAASVAYVPVLLVGSTLYLRRCRRLSTLGALLLGITFVALFMAGLRSIHTAFWPLDNSYLLSLAYALSLFTLLLDRPTPAVLRRVGDISYSVYLLHGVVGFLVAQHAAAAGAGALTPWLATASSLLLAAAMHRTIERPSIALGRRWTRHART